MITDVELSRALNALATTVKDQRPRSVDAERFQSILDGARTQTANAYHGRGLNLLFQLCDSLTFHGAGNDVEALFRWGDAGEEGYPNVSN